jgi:hypothetical protein
MEVRIYDSEMDLKGIIENQTSLIWTRKYNDPGEFELHTPLTEDNRLLLKIGNLVYKKGASEAGTIESVTIEETETKNEITASGRFLSSYMDRRVTKATKTYSGKAEEIMRQLLSEDTIAIPRVELGELVGFTDTIEFQVTYKNLLTYMSKLAKQFNYGYRFRPDFNLKKIIFEIYAGKDKSLSQAENNRVVFSEKYENLNSATYTENTQTYKTKVYVGGEGEGSARTVVSVGEGEGLDLREDFVSASDISSSEITTAQYTAAMEERGRQTLESSKYVKSFEFEADPYINFSYKTDYDVGDIVTIKKSAWGIREDMRITAVQEIYENGAMTIVPTLGDPLPETINWEDN